MRSLRTFSSAVRLSCVVDKINKKKIFAQAFRNSHQTQSQRKTENTERENLKPQQQQNVLNLNAIPI